MRDLITWYKECATENPKLTFVITVWLCIIAPLGFVPDSVTQSEAVKSFVNYMTGWAPMIKDFASHSSRPYWHGFALSVIWAWGPIVMLYAARHTYRTNYPEFDKNGKKRMGSTYAFWATIFSCLVVMAFAHADYKYFSGNESIYRSLRDKFTNYIFGNSWGLWTFGWSMIWIFWSWVGLAFGYYAARKVESI